MKIAQIMLAAAAAAGVMFILSGCGDSPATVAENWMKACRDGDLKKANECTTEKIHIANKGVVEMVLKADKEQRATIEKNSNKSIEMLKKAKTEINGDEATITIPGERGAMKFKKIDGKWKIDSML